MPSLKPIPLGQDEESSPFLGFLAGLGRVLDTPGRIVRSAIAGKEDASGRDVLQKLGILGPNQEGFDLGDLAGFAAEVVADPLTYLGIAPLTRAGKAASRTSELVGRMKAAKGFKRPVEEILSIKKALKGAAKDLGGGPPQLAKTLAEQGRLGQRSALSFAGIPINVPGALPLLDKVGSVAKRIPGADLMGKLFNPQHGRIAALRPFREELDRGLRGAVHSSADDVAKLKAILDPVVERGEFDRKAFVDAIETQGLKAKTPEELQNAAELRQFMERLMAKTGDESLAPRIAGDALEPVAFRTQEEAEAGQLFRNILDTQAEAEISAGARTPGAILGENSPIKYFPRTLSDPGDAWRRANPEAFASKFLGTPGGRDLKHELGRDSTLRSIHRGSEIPRSPETMGRLTSEVSGELAQERGLPSWFEMDPAKALNRRLVSGRSSVETAHFARSIIREFPSDATGIPARDFASAMGLHLPAGSGADRFVPQAVAAEAIRLYKKVSEPEELTRLGELFDKVTGIFKYSLTIPIPAYHARNLLSDTTLSAWHDGANPALIGQAWKQSRDPEWLRRGDELGVFHGSKSAVAKGELGIGESPGRMARFTEKADKLTGAVERFTRTWHYLSMKAKGLTDMEAAARVRHDLLDYSQLTDFERRAMKRAIPFYSWTRRVIPTIVEAYVKHPGKSAFLTRATTLPSVEREGQVPEWIRQSAALPLGQNEQGDPTYLTGLGSPLEELNKVDISSPEGGWLGAARTLARKTAIQLNPLARVPIELATGRDLFYDRPLLAGDRAPAILNAPILKQIFGTREDVGADGKTRFSADPLMMHLLRSSPFSRFVQTGSNLADAVSGIDPRKSGLQSLTQALTGIRTPSVDAMDQERTKADLLMRDLTGLQREGKAGRIEIPFLTERGKEDPAAVEKMTRLREVKKLMKRLRAEQASAPP